MHHAPIIPLVLFLAFTTTSPGKAATQHAWRVQQLHKDNNEGIAVGDINGDGQLDITSGEFWYQAPDFKQRPLRKILPFGADYMQNNSEHLYDMDGDGDLDVLSGAFTLKNVDWFENPGEGNYAKGLWSVHQLVDTGTGYNEATFLHDIDGDGTPEFIENSWNPKNPMQIFRLVRGGMEVSQQASMSSPRVVMAMVWVSAISMVMVDRTSFSNPAGMNSPQVDRSQEHGSITMISTFRTPVAPSS